MKCLQVPEKKKEKKRFKTKIIYNATKNSAIKKRNIFLHYFRAIRITRKRN